VTDTDIVLTGYLEHAASNEELTVTGRMSLQLSAGPGLAGCLLSALGGKVTITNQEEKKMLGAMKNVAKMEALENIEPPSASLLPFEKVSADDDSKASLPWSLLISSDEFLVWDDDAASLLVATLSRLSDFETNPNPNPNWPLYQGYLTSRLTLTLTLIGHSIKAI